jgi:hypothetical protein
MFAIAIEGGAVMLFVLLSGAHAGVCNRRHHWDTNHADTRPLELQLGVGIDC